MKTRLVLAALAATASLAACGGEDPAPASGANEQESANRKAMLDYARCMRENGIDMPDPQFDGGKVTQRVGGPGTNPEKMRAAEQACAEHRDKIKPPEISDEQKEEFRKAALENAKCMREQGIDMPDPQFSDNGGVMMRLPAGVKPDSEKFQRAQEACRETLPEGPGTTEAGEGGQ